MKGLPVRGARAATNKANKAKGNPFGKPEAKEMMMSGKMGKKVEVPKRKKMG
jgi:hypothetical protein